MIIEEFRERLKERESEIESCLALNKHYQEQLKVVQEQCKKLKDQLAEMKNKNSRDAENHDKRFSFLFKYFDRIERMKISFFKEK